MPPLSFIHICPVVVRGDTRHPHYQLLAVLPNEVSARWQLPHGLGCQESAITTEAVRIIRSSVGYHKISFTGFVIPAVTLLNETTTPTPPALATSPIRYMMVFPVIKLWDTHEYELSARLSDHRWLDSTDILRGEVPCRGTLTHAAEIFFSRVRRGERV